MPMPEQFLPNRKRTQPISLPHDFSDEEMDRDWFLSAKDKTEINKYWRSFRLGIAVQLCAVRLYGRFLTGLQDLSPRILNHPASQLALPPTLTIEEPEREATALEQRKNILRYLGFQRFDNTRQAQLQSWLEEQAKQYRHKLPRRVFFADQGEFTTGDYEALMNKASCLSLVSNAILYWNTLKITDIVDQLRQQGEAIEDETLAHVSLLPFKHVLPNGTYFFKDDYPRAFGQKGTVLTPGRRPKP